MKCDFPVINLVPVSVEMVVVFNYIHCSAGYGSTELYTPQEAEKGLILAQWLGVIMKCWSPFHTASLIPGEYNPGEYNPGEYNPGEVLSHGYPGAVSHCPRPRISWVLIPQGSAHTFHTMIKSQGNRAIPVFTCMYSYL